MTIMREKFTDWIKMRDLTSHPKVAAMSRILQETYEFREWLTPGGGAGNGATVSHAASRCVVTALLLRVWTSARKYGKFVGNDLVLEHNCIADLDALAGVENFGVAMQRVGWALAKNGVTLPNFKNCNVPLTDAERQRLSRERKKRASQGVTKASRSERDETSRNVTLEKRRVNNTPLPPELNTNEFALVWQEWLKHRSETRHPLKPTAQRAQLKKLAAMGLERAIAAIEHSIANGYQGIFEPKTPPGVPKPPEPPPIHIPDELIPPWDKDHAAGGPLCSTKDRWWQYGDDYKAGRMTGPDWWRDTPMGRKWLREQGRVRP
jgi:hypothetical protein